MTASDIQPGKVFYFGRFRSAPNTVTSVTPLTNGQFIARVNLTGPRGGEFVAYVTKDGVCRKI